MLYGDFGPTNIMPTGQGPGRVPIQQQGPGTPFQQGGFYPGAGGGGGGLGGLLQGNLGNILGGGMGLLNLIQGQQGMNQQSPFLDAGNWNNIMNENIEANPFASQMQDTWGRMGGQADMMNQFAQQGPQFGTGGAQSVAPAQGMLQKNFNQLSNFNPKEMKQDRGEARERMQGNYMQSGPVAQGMQQAAQARKDQPQQLGQTASARGRSNTLAQGQDIMGAQQKAHELSNRDIGMSAELGKNINQQQLQGKLGATGAASAHGQLGLGGFGADTQRGLGSYSAQGNMMGQAGNLLGQMGQQQGTAFGQTYIDPKDQAQFAQDQYNAMMQQRNAGGGGLLGGLSGMFGGGGGGGLLSGLTGLAGNFIPGMGLVSSGLKMFGK